MMGGLEAVFAEEFPNAEVQRCQVHVARNVIAKVPKKLKKELADDLRLIFYAKGEKHAREFYEGCIEKRERLSFSVEIILEIYQSLLNLHEPFKSRVVKSQNGQRD